MNVGYLMTRSARIFGDRTAFIIGGKAATFKHVNERINRLANGLLSLGLKKGDRVGLLFHNSFGYIEAHLALYKAGLIWVRLNHRLALKDLRAMVEDSGMAALIHGPEFGEQASQFGDNLQWVISLGSGP